MPIFEAQKRESDGKMLPSDVVLQIAAAVVFEFPPAETVNSVKLEIKWKGSPSVARIFMALLKKHLGAIDSHGKRREARKAAREIILDILVQKKDWKPYAAIFSAFAERNDRDFFEQLVRGIQRKRKGVFAADEWFLLLNWDEWTETLAPDLLKNPPLRFWTDEAVLALLELRFPKLKLGLSGLRTKRVRLGLEQGKPAKVTGVFPVEGKPGFVAIKSTD
jgi:hypothetical protein